MTEWLVAFVVFALLQLIVWKLPFFKSPKLHVFSAGLLFTAKAIAGIMLWLIYTFYYTNKFQADIYKYYDDGLVIKEICFENPYVGSKILFGLTDQTTQSRERMLCHWKRPFSRTMLNENALIIRMNALLSFISFGYYQVHNLFFCFLSFLGTWMMVRFFESFLDRKNLIALFLITLFPSLLLWSSGILKESIICFSLGLFMYALRPMLTKKKTALTGITVVFSILVLLYTRSLLALICLVVLVGFFASSFADSMVKKMLCYFLVFAGLFASAYLLKTINSKYDYFKVMAHRQRYEYEFAHSLKAGSIVELPRITKEPSSIIKALPFGLFNAFVQPNPFQPNQKMFSIISGIENLIVLGIITFLLISIRKPSQEFSNHVLFLLFICLIYLSVIGLLTPVAGNLVRYKSVIMPLLFGVLLMLQKGNKEQLS